MGPGVTITFTIFTWLLLSTEARVIREIAEQNLESFSPCVSYTLNSLLHVDCSNRDLTELPMGLDTSANVLLLSNNQLTSFPPQLQDFVQLKHLDLSTNHLNSPLPAYFENMDKLHRLNLSDNNYDVWVDTGFHNFKTLDLSKNKIHNIEETAFNKMILLNFLNLAENRLKDLPPKLFINTPNLQNLFLSRNYFTTIPRFESNSLKTLDLNSCQISDLESDSLVGMASILELFLSMNQVEKIPDNFASNTLQELDLSYNIITSLNDNSFSSLPHLAVLNLRGNDFKDVWSTSHFASNPYLRVVHVKGNRWSCEGFNVNLLLMYEFLSKDPPKVTDSGSLICYSPANVTQMSWQQAYIRTWHPNDGSPMSITTFAVFIGVIIGVVLTSCICRGLVAVSGNNQPLQAATVVNLNGSAPQPATETVVLRVPLHDQDLPPSYDEALLMPRLNASFHSLPDFVDEEEDTSHHYRRSRSIGDLTEYRPRTHDRRSVRRTIQPNATASNSRNDDCE